MSGEKQNVQDYRGVVIVATVWLIFYVIAVSSATWVTISNAIEPVAR
jgi:hypothetical protein